ncbi:helix-turn-helix domain-containing protein [Dysgonomonas massiliensis]|uniref:helix-turn-helix domain-containing protein n=1 Tax=Dysgonomonas massiliensis TaxID=2040292 RepID=UPI000C772CCC|nr:helix-turn-helix domain-containing protein [Dysgonomonas massiliensis]
MITAELYIQDFCNKNRLKVDEIKGKSRKKPLVDYRHVLFYNLREMFNMTLQDIAKMFGLNHASVVHAVNKIEVQKDIYNDIKSICELNPIVKLENK